VSKASLLALLRSAMIGRPRLKPLIDFLGQELASVKEMSV
jgi:hypothetical protein